jgi:hypothetical protein
MSTTSNSGSRVENGKVQSALGGFRSRTFLTPSSSTSRIPTTRTNLHVKGETAKRCTLEWERRCYKYSLTSSPPPECMTISNSMMFKRRSKRIHLIPRDLTIIRKIIRKVQDRRFL